MVVDCHSVSPYGLQRRNLSNSIYRRCNSFGSQKADLGMLDYIERCDHIMFAATRGRVRGVPFTGG